MFKQSSAGVSQSIAPPLEPASDTITLVAGLGGTDTTYPVILPTGEFVTIHTKVYRHTQSKHVVLTQRVVAIQLRRPDTHSYVAQTVGGQWSVWVDGSDRRGSSQRGECSLIHLSSWCTDGNAAHCALALLFIGRHETHSSRNRT